MKCGRKNKRSFFFFEMNIGFGCDERAKFCRIKRCEEMWCGGGGAAENGEWDKRKKENGGNGESKRGEKCGIKLWKKFSFFVFLLFFH